MTCRASFFFAKLFFLSTFVVSSPARAGLDDLLGTKPGDLEFGGQFEGADGCAVCHGGSCAGNRSYLPHDSWAGTMMANAARDPIFRAALTIANQDAPGVGTFCLRCHSPIAFVRGHATPADGTAFDDIDRQGIGCDTCHRAIASGPTDAPYYAGNAQIVYSSDLAKHGPYNDSVVPVHQTMADAPLSSAHFCGQCHQVTNPTRFLRDAAGKETNLEFPLDTTYQEWKNSDFSIAGGKTCIDCHLERTKENLPVATSANAPFRDQPRNHAFVGGNLFGIRAVMAANPDRANAFPDAFVLALGQTQTLLESAVSVQITSAPANAMPGESIHVTVRVDNHSGHKFPTGYAEGRRAWIAWVLETPDGNEIFLSGDYDPTTGDIVDSGSTHIYRAQHGFWNGTSAEPSENLARNDMILSDTRIPPKGFIATPGTVPTSEIDYGDSTSGFRHYDEASFDLTIPANIAGDVVLSARIYYQSITRAYVEHLAAVNVTDTSGQDLHDIYDQIGADKPTLLSRNEVSIVIPTAGQTSSSSSGMVPSGNGPVAPSRGCDCASSCPMSDGFGATIAFGIALISALRRVRWGLSRR